MEKDLEQKLNAILHELKKLNVPWWKHLTNGFLTSFGSIIGLVFAIALLGYVAAAFNLPNKLGTLMDNWLNSKIQNVNNQINPIQKYMK